MRFRRLPDWNLAWSPLKCNQNALTFKSAAKSQWIRSSFLGNESKIVQVKEGFHGLGTSWNILSNQRTCTPIIRRVSWNK